MLEMRTLTGEDLERAVAHGIDLGCLAELEVDGRFARSGDGWTFTGRVRGVSDPWGRVDALRMAPDAAAVLDRVAAWRAAE